MNAHLHIAFAPQISVHIIGALAATALILSGFGILRRARGGWGRLGLFALLILTLVNPSIIKEQHEPLKDTAVIAVDNSASMAIGDRHAQAAKALTALMQKLAGFPDLDVRTVQVSGEEETDLFTALSPILADIPHDRLAGIIAVTDGEVHDTPDRALDAPFHVLVAGQHDEVDRRLTIKSAPAYGIVGKRVTLTLRVDDAPKAQSETAEITFRRDDGSRQDFAIPTGKDIPFDVSVDHPGPNLFAFETPGLPNELTTLNNSAAANVNGIRDRLRVLLVSGEPHIGGRTWRNLLKADPAVDLVHFTILRSPNKESLVPSNQLSLITFPVNELFNVKLHSFDLVILDRFRNRSLMPDEYLENIAKYVENGGSLLVSNDTDDTPPENADEQEEAVLSPYGVAPNTHSLNDSSLARVLPAEPTGKILTGRFIPDLTDAGKRHPVTAGLTQSSPRETWGPWYRQIETAHVNGSILMKGLQDQPLLVLNRVGEGRVAQFLSDEFWLWARNYEDGGPQAELLRRVGHWLMQEPELDEGALRAHAEHTADGWQLVITERSLHDDTAAVSVFDPEERPVQVKLSPDKQPGVLTATVSLKETGLYHVKDGDKDVLVLVGPMNVPEFGDMRATEDRVASILEATDGKAVWLADHPEGVDIHRTNSGSAQSGWNWMGLRKSDQYRISGSKAYPLWPLWLALAALLAVVMATWRREGRA